MTILALDLGSTSIKAARFAADGKPQARSSRPTPPIRGGGHNREFDAEEYRAAAEEALRPLWTEHIDAVGIASQRSSFTLWDRRGRPQIPVISWQDRRAGRVCAELQNEAIVQLSGLRLSPHYAGPKLATLFAADPELGRRAAAGELLFGTLETYLLWRWSGGTVHRTDLTMAARTQLVDIERGAWDDELLRCFAVPNVILPAITDDRPRAAVVLGREVDVVSIADQPAGTIAAVGTGADSLMINAGTGTFVLRTTGTEILRRRGYLTGPMLHTEHTHYATEGTINGGGQVVDAQDPGPSDPSSGDVHGDAFCLPDAAGVGAPHFAAEKPFTLSPAAASLDAVARRRIVLEGLVFRVREIVDGLGCDAPRRIAVSGGLCREPFTAPALAACLQRPVEVVDDPDSTLIGAARLAQRQSENVLNGRRVVAPPQLSYLGDKYLRWRDWLGQVLRDG